MWRARHRIVRRATPRRRAQHAALTVAFVFNLAGPTGWGSGSPELSARYICASGGQRPSLAWRRSTSAWRSFEPLFLDGLFGRFGDVALQEVGEQRVGGAGDGLPVGIRPRGPARFDDRRALPETARFLRAKAVQAAQGAHTRKANKQAAAAATPPAAKTPPTAPAPAAPGPAKA
jgi:hypothetical protein